MTNFLFDLYGKVALITGTSRRLGQYFARVLGRAGAGIAMRITQHIQDISIVSTLRR
jgi:NAD(P)-dependent dehydrogenase (short-subunit alcohol dehydrogenase family)